MKSAIASLVLLAVTLPSAAFASWDNGDPFVHPGSKENPDPVELRDLVVKNGFGAQFWIIPEDSITGRWFQMDARKLKAVGSTRRNAPVAIAVYFVNGLQKRGFVRLGPKVEEMSLVNVTFDLKVTRPDGVVENFPDLPAWQGAAPPPYLLQIAKAKAVITFDVEPTGPYKFQVTVHDHFRKVSIGLERRLNVYE